MAWIARVLLIVAGVVASWWIAEDAPLFPIVEMVVVIALVILVLLAIACWPLRKRLQRNKP